MTLEQDIQDAIPKTEISMFKRLLIRSVVLIFLMMVAALTMEVLVAIGKGGYWNINERWPEMINIFRAGMILTWAEVTLIWIRMAVAPKIDVQAIMLKAVETPIGAAIVSAGLLLQWVARLWIFLELSGLLK